MGDLGGHLGGDAGVAVCLVGDGAAEAFDAGEGCAFGGDEA